MQQLVMMLQPGLSGLSVVPVADDRRPAPMQLQAPTMALKVLFTGSTQPVFKKSKVKCGATRWRGRLRQGSAVNLPT